MMVQWAIFAAVCFLLLPITAQADLVLDAREKKCYFLLRLYGKLRLAGGYAAPYAEGVALHLSGRRAFLFPLRDFAQNTSRMQLLRGFRLLSCAYYAEVGFREAAGAAVLAAAALQIAGGIAAGILRAGGHRVRPRGTSLYLGKDRLQLGFRAVIFFTPLVLAAALGKALIQNFQEGKNDHERRFG